MHIAGIMLGCVLLGQTTAHHRAEPPDMVARATVLPSRSTLTGKPLPLLEAISSTTDRRQQLETVRAYWQVAARVAEYHYWSGHVDRLSQIATRGGDASLQTGLSAAASGLRDAEMVATRAQQALATVARLPAGAALPWPSDQPHVGRYRTSFAELFALRTPPEPAYLAEKILRPECDAIADFAAAVRDAENAAAAVIEDFQAGRGSAAAVVTCSEDLLRQQRAFVEAVCDYNRRIADYALMVVSPATPPETLVATLVAPPSPKNNATPGRDGRSVSSADASDPASELRTARNQPTLAPPRVKNEPTLAPPREKNEPTPAPPVTRQANKPDQSTFSLRPEQNETTDVAPLYTGLVNVSPAVRAKQLTVALHGERLPKELGKPIGLAECLHRSDSRERQQTIDAYWLVWQRAAKYQVLLEQAELLKPLDGIVLRHRNDPTGASDGLRLQAAKSAAKAAAGKARVELVEAQYALALRIGAVAEASWPLASTLPHAGGYLLKFDRQPANVAESAAAQRLATAVPNAGESVRERAATVVEADTARVAATDEYRARGSIAGTLAAITAQSEQTTRFLDALAQYNRAIAEYAILVLPPTAPAEKLAASLVVKP